MPELHRIQFADFDPDVEGWADIPVPRSFGARLGTNMAAAAGARAYGLQRVALYVTNWSLEGSPLDEDFVAKQDDDLMTWLLNQAEDRYEEVRRSRAERKSDRERAAGDIRPSGVRADDSAGPRAVA